MGRVEIEGWSNSIVEYEEMQIQRTVSVYSMFI